VILPRCRSRKAIPAGADQVPHRRAGDLPRFEGQAYRSRPRTAAGARRRRARVLAGGSAGRRAHPLPPRRQAGNAGAGGSTAATASCRRSPTWFPTARLAASS
jgi:hypothetical protein